METATLKVQRIIQEMDGLSLDELSIILRETTQRMDRLQKAITALELYCGKGAGVWQMDAQEYVNDLREERD